MVGYAGDGAALVAARSADQAQIKLYRVVRNVSRWMAAHGLYLALKKTEVITLTTKMIPTILSLRFGHLDMIVVTKPLAKYCGVLIDTKIVHQIRHPADKLSRRSTD